MPRSLSAETLRDPRRAGGGDLGWGQLVSCPQGFVHQVPGCARGVPCDVLKTQQVRQLVGEGLTGPGMSERADDTRGPCLDGLAAEVAPFEVRHEENRQARLRREPPDEVEESVAVDPVQAARDFLPRRLEGLDVKLDVRLAEDVVGAQEGLVEAWTVLPGRAIRVATGQAAA